LLIFSYILPFFLLKKLNLLYICYVLFYYQRNLKYDL
jgi:hypothetical protein